MKYKVCPSGSANKSQLLHNIFVATDAGPYVAAAVMGVGGAGAQGPLWNATNKLSAAENALAHYNKHGARFPEYNNAKQYVEGAKDFFRNPPPGTRVKTRQNGDRVLYNPRNNTFGVQAPNGAPKTMFKPDPAIHGYPSNVDYYNAQ